MKFGKEFRTHLEETLPEWRDKFLCYKPLKKLLKHFPNPNIPLVNHNTNTNQNVGGEPSQSGGAAGVRNMSLEEFQDWFVRLLNEELEKFNDFYVDKEEEFVIRFQAGSFARIVLAKAWMIKRAFEQNFISVSYAFVWLFRERELKERIERVRENSRRDRVAASESEFSEEMMDIRKAFVTIHGEMVLLKNYSSLNFAGLIKILKKYDKRTGGLLRLPFTQLAAHQPFFTTEPLTRLVRECEANLELLFPLEEEVTESTSAPRDQNRADPPLADITNTPPETSSLGEATHDIYRSTLSAIRTIQGLRTSSTYNPLSFAAIFRDQDDEGSGAVTAENSASNLDPEPSGNADADEKDDADSAP
ncbi:hypothetical protein Cgig2_023072 [Carnegiea gigantea]|uniref:SPX domain-containing protein n=1 Tax=Carnegiea gigantea TaxID=171969 RepID=A0A9Q1JXX4_9CARY|nr:hypothetical protein Cgig2_023072 [Carnegiea gigantea]